MKQVERALSIFSLDDNVRIKRPSICESLFFITLVILTVVFMFYQATNDNEYTPKKWGAYSNGELVDTFNSYAECDYISDGHGACAPIVEEK